MCLIDIYNPTPESCRFLVTSSSPLITLTTSVSSNEPILSKTIHMPVLLSSTSVPSVFANAHLHSAISVLWLDFPSEGSCLVSMPRTSASRHLVAWGQWHSKASRKLGPCWSMSSWQQSSTSKRSIPCRSGDVGMRRLGPSARSWWMQRWRVSKRIASEVGGNDRMMRALSS